MKEEIITIFIYESGYLQIYLLVLLYFLFLYFALAPAFQNSCRLLESKNLVHKIVDRRVRSKQVYFEIKHSLVSIFIFGFSGIPIIFLIRQGSISLAEDNFINIAAGVILLNVWNEIHFFVVHRIMHLPYFMKRVHFIHHKSMLS